MMLKVRCATRFAPCGHLVPIFHCNGRLQWRSGRTDRLQICYSVAMFRSPPSSSCVLVLIAVLSVARVLAQAPGPATEAASSGPELRVFDPSLIDKTVDPCENFYRYSCNGWFKRNPLPPDQTSYGRTTELYEANRLYLKQILEQAAIPSPTCTANEQKIPCATCFRWPGTGYAGGAWTRITRSGAWASSSSAAWPAGPVRPGRRRRCMPWRRGAGCPGPRHSGR